MKERREKRGARWEEKEGEEVKVEGRRAEERAEGRGEERRERVRTGPAFIPRSFQILR